MVSMSGLVRRHGARSLGLGLQRWRGVLVASVLLLQAGGVAAQTPSCTVQPAATPPPRQILRCADGLVLEAEAGADYALRVRSSTGPVQAVSLSRGAVLVQAPPQVVGRGFQVMT